MSLHDETQQAVNEALQGYLGEDELAISWTLTIEVMAPSGGRYLAHRAGGGIDGTEVPTIWSVLGMLEGAAQSARGQMRQQDVPDEDEEEDDDAS